MEYGYPFSRRPLHAPIIADIAKQEIASLLPPQGALGWPHIATKSGCQLFDTLIYGHNAR
jgi:hypothetical protein